LSTLVELNDSWVFPLVELNDSWSCLPLLSEMVLELALTGLLGLDHKHTWQSHLATIPTVSYFVPTNGIPNIQQSLSLWILLVLSVFMSKGFFLALSNLHFLRHITTRCNILTRCLCTCVCVVSFRETRTCQPAGSRTMRSYGTLCAPWSGLRPGCATSTSWQTDSCPTGLILRTHASPS